MFHRVRRKMRYVIVLCAIFFIDNSCSKFIETTENSAITNPFDDNFDNNIIDFDDEYSVKYNKKYGLVPWHGNNFSKESHKYTVVNNKPSEVSKDIKNKQIKGSIKNETDKVTTESGEDTTTFTDYSVIPLELLSTTDDSQNVETTTEVDLTVIPLTTPDKATTTKIQKELSDIDNATLPVTTIADTTTEGFENITELTTEIDNSSTTVKNNITLDEIESKNNDSIIDEALRTNSSETVKVIKKSDDDSFEDDVPIFTELDVNDDSDVPEDYYDGKDVIPTKAPNNDALSVIFGLAGSVVESVAEKVVPKSIFDLFKRMQKQSEALEAEKLRSREENGGLGQFGRGILKSISSGLSKPLSQLMAGVRDIGSLDSDRSFVNNIASSVTSVANVATSVVDAFKDRVQAIYPGTVWCGDGHSATARSGSELGLFFFTDTCCRQHDACKLYIKAGETKYGLTNTGLFTRSHCSCDVKFRECLRRTNSLVSAQIGLTYFNVLGPQCFRKAHPIVKCVTRTRLTGQKCEEYELDFTKPKMWQWFDTETF